MARSGMVVATASLEPDGWDWFSPFTSHPAKLMAFRLRDDKSGEHLRHRFPPMAGRLPSIRVDKLAQSVMNRGYQRQERSGGMEREDTQPWPRHENEAPGKPDGDVNPYWEGPIESLMEAHRDKVIREMTGY